MEGIPVKINEKYKPPKKITLPACLINRLNNTQFSTLTYDFELETTVAKHMSELNKISQDEIDRRLENTIVVNSSPETSPEKSTLDEVGTKQKEPSILTPVPISSNQPVSAKENNSSHIQYSDFENDTSSPFDNEELKTINDMEELAHVLGIGNVISGQQLQNNENCHSRVPPVGGNVGVEQWPTMSYGSPSQGHYFHPPRYQPITTPKSYSSAMHIASSIHSTYPITNHQHYPATVNSFSSPKNEEVNVSNHTDGKEDDRVAEIVKSLQDCLGQRRVSQNPNNDENRHQVVPLSTTSTTNSSLFQSLGDQDQAMARRLGEMGFSLTSATAAVKLFGSDESKIIEYLLLVKSFVDKGYDETQTIHALEANSQDEGRTEQYLDVLGQIMKLGFKEDDVATALASTKNDRDKALDILIR